MKKLLGLLFIAISISTAFISCSKSKVSKQDFFSQLDALVKKAENNNLIDAVEGIQNEYKEFFQKYPNIASSKDWTAADTEKMEDLMKRFTIATTISTFSDDLGWDDSSFDDFGFDLGLDGDLNYGDVSGIDSALLEDLSFSNELTSPDLGMDDIFGGLTSDLLSPTPAFGDLGFSELSVPLF